MNTGSDYPTEQRCVTEERILQIYGCQILETRVTSISVPRW